MAVYSLSIQIYIAAYAVVYAPVWVPALITTSAAIGASVASWNLGKALQQTSIGNYEQANESLNKVEVALGATATVVTGGLAFDQLATTKLASNAKVADNISKGHAYDKHVVQRGEFKGIVYDNSDLKTHVENVINKPSNIRSLEGGRTAYLQKSTNTIVIKDPQSKDYGTAFQPSSLYHGYKSTYEYFKKGLRYLYVLEINC